MLWTVVFFLSIAAAQAGQVTLAWNASAGPVAGYQVYYGTTSGHYTAIADAGNATQYIMADLADGATYYFVVRAYDGAGNQSGFSNEVSATVGAMSSPSGGPPPSPWLGMDIGNIGVVGSASYADGTFTLHGSGADIWRSADAFHFAFQPLEGDGSIVARVASLTHTHAWAKAGVMIRENLDADARHAMVVVTPGNGVSFQRRTTTGGSSASTTVAGILAPHWVKLTRADNTFTAHQSPDGVTWTPVGSPVTIDMGSSVYVGLALTSHNNDVLNTATLDNVSVPTGSSAQAGQVTLAWNASAGPVAGYRVYYGTASGHYPASANAGNTTTFTVTNLTASVTYYFAVRAYDGTGSWSGFSNEVSATVGVAPSP